MEQQGLHTPMPDDQQATSTATPQPANTPSPNRELGSLASASNEESFRQVLAKPSTIVGIVLGIVVAGVVIVLQTGPSHLTLDPPEAKYELLPNEGLVEGVPIAIQLGPLTLFQLADPMAGGAGAVRARQVVENLNSAVLELGANQNRVITIESSRDEGMPRIVQKATPNSTESIEIVTVTSDDMTLMSTDDAKLLARVWAERLTDSMKLLVFAKPPEFSRDTDFGAALDTLYVNARRESAKLTSAKLAEAFEELPSAQREALTSVPTLPTTADTLSVEEDSSGS